MIIHTKDIPVGAMQAELREHPWRLEEKHDDEGDESGNTPLISSAMHGNIAVIELLLSLGANVEAKDMVCLGSSARKSIGRRFVKFPFCQFGNNALLKAARGGHSEIVELLVQAGANVNERDRVCFQHQNWK